jgi:hypothetical protein
VDGCCYQKENEEIISSREDKETGLTWKEYKSITFTMHASRNNIWILFFFFAFYLFGWLV